MPALLFHFNLANTPLLPRPFVQVTSFSGGQGDPCEAADEVEATQQPPKKGAAGGDAGSARFGSAHVALNFWVHPPDNLDPSPAGFGSPYRGHYWPDLWQRRAAAGGGGGAAASAGPERDT